MVGLEAEVVLARQPSRRRLARAQREHRTGIVLEDEEPVVDVDPPGEAEEAPVELSRSFAIRHRERHVAEAHQAAALTSASENAVSSSRPVPPPRSSISRSANTQSARASESRSDERAAASVFFAAHGG